LAMVETTEIRCFGVEDWCGAIDRLNRRSAAQKEYLPCKT
jgi:hypothetical protein